jgi:steroid delta-isomerase-like uncharacterized protein
VNDGRAAAGALVAAMTDHDVDGVVAQWHRRGVHHHPLFGDLAVPAQLHRHLTELFGALPDLVVDVESTSATDTTATIRHRLIGTFTGTPWAGVPANGRALDLDVVLFVRIDDGFIVEADELFDSAALAEQLGFRPGDTSPAARMKRGLGQLRARARRSA